MRIFSICSLLCAASVALSAADLRIMTIGDSLTAGFIYQSRLKTLLEGAGHTVTFVGSQGSSPNLHEGFSGKGIYQFVGAIPASGDHYITTALNAAWPSAPASAVPIVLVHIGINDLGHGLGRVNLANAPLDGSGNCLASQQYAQSGSGSWIDPMGNLDGMTYGNWLKLRLNTLVDTVLAHPSQPRLVIAKILPIAKGNSAYTAYNDNCCERIKEWNGYWATKAASVTGGAASRITVVDCYTDAESKRVYGAVPGASFWGDATAQAGDWVHPNSAVGGGYSLMATQFKGGIDALLGAPAVKAATWSASGFTEAAANDGSISAAITVTLANETFTGANGDNLVAQSKVTVANLPAGLSATVARTSATQLTITLTGSAAAHAHGNDVANLQFTFANTAVAGGAASAVTGLSVSDRTIDFADPAPVGGLLVAEPFAYTAGTGALANQNGGSGWTAAWDAGSQPIVSPGMAFANGGTLDVLGNRAGITAGITSFRSLPTTLSNGTWWIAFLARSESPGNQWGGVSLFHGGSEQLFVGQRYGSLVWGLERNGGVNSVTGSGADALLVVKLVLKSGNDDAFLWVNPSLASAPSEALAAQHLAFADLTVDRVRLAGDVNLRIDELRIASTFAAATAVLTAAPGQLDWSAATATVTEGGNLTLTVSRTGGSAGAVAVSYATAVGTASAGDFTATSGALNFADGETSKTVTVATVQDGLVEGAETFTVVLSAPTGGASLGTSTVVVTIADDDAAAGTGGAGVKVRTKSGSCGAGGALVLLSAMGMAVCFTNRPRRRAAGDTPAD